MTMAASLEARMPFMDVELAKFAASLPGVIRVDILPFNRGGKEKSARLANQNRHIQVDTPSEEQMNSIAKSLSKYGFEVKIGG